MPKPHDPLKLRMVCLRLSEEHIAKIDRLARQLSQREGAPRSKSDAFRHLLNNYQPRRN